MIVSQVFFFFELKLLDGQTYKWTDSRACHRTPPPDTPNFCSDAMIVARRNWCKSITKVVASVSTQRLQAPIPGCFRLPWDWRSAPFLLANPIRARGDFDGGWASGVRMDKALAPSGDGLHGDGVCRHEITSAIVTHPAREVLGNQIGVLVQTLDHGIGVPST